MHIVTRRRRHCWSIAAAGLLLALTGCTVRIAGTPVADPSALARLNAEASTTPGSGTKPAPGKDAGEDTRASAYGKLRAIDPCALHSIEAAAKVTGMQPDEIMPGANLGVCDLKVAPNQRELSAWTLTTTVGVDLDENLRQEASPEQIGGVEFLKMSELDGSGDDRCRYAMSFGTDTGIELQVRRDALEAQPKTPCQIATEYLTEVGRYWKEPATRSDGVTSPNLAIAEVDPCAGMDALAEDLGGGELRTMSFDPFSCQIMPATPTQSGTGGTVSVDVGVDTDPRTLATGDNREYKAISVSGKPGVAHETPSPKGSFCSVSVITDERVALEADQTRSDPRKSFQILNIRADTCDIASKAAEAVLAQLG